MIRCEPRSRARNANASFKRVSVELRLSEIQRPPFVGRFTSDSTSERLRHTETRGGNGPSGGQKGPPPFPCARGWVDLSTPACFDPLSGFRPVGSSRGKVHASWVTHSTSQGLAVLPLSRGLWESASSRSPAGALPRATAITCIELEWRRNTRRYGNRRRRRSCVPCGYAGQIDGFVAINSIARVELNHELRQSHRFFQQATSILGHSSILPRQ